MQKLKFNEWIQENKSSIVIRMDSYKSALLKRGEEYKESIRERNLKARDFNKEKFLIQIQRVFADYPHLDVLVSLIRSGDTRKIMSLFKDLRLWIANQSYNPELRATMTQLWTLIDHLEYGGEDSSSILEINQLISEAVNKTVVEMEQVKNLINQSIAKIENWNNSPITIEPTIPEDEHGIALSPTKNSYIYLGDYNKHTFFTLYLDEGKLEIDEIADGGDEDFFDNDKIQSDYFSLIEKLKNPNAKDKILTLYTARPRKDRNYYLASKVLPINLFLTNSFSHAEGIALDFAEEGEKRDVWKVKINSKYLTQTLDGNIKYYQITKNNSPAISMELM